MKEGIKKIKIRPSVSLRMGLDNNKIRAAEDKIKALGFSIGDMVLLNGHSGMIVLELDKAFKEDLEENKGRGIFVSSSVFSRVKDWDAYVRPYSFLLGCDPEFFVVGNLGKSEEVLAANSFLKKHSDYALGEIRPAPSATVGGLVSNIESELKDAYGFVSKMPFIKFYGKSYMSNMCAGFHIHFNMPQEILCFVGADSSGMIKSIVSILDSSVGLISRLDPNSGARMESDQNYGKLGDFKLSMRTLEYRVPGSYWLRSRETCSLILGYSYYIFQKILVRMKHLSKNWKFAVDETKLRETLNLPSKSETNIIHKSVPKEEIVLKLLGKPHTLEEDPNMISNWRLA